MDVKAYGRTNFTSIALLELARYGLLTSLRTSRSRAPATAAWPRLMPPSLHGTRRCTRTRKPASVSLVTTWLVSSRFWNTPPDSATTARPVCSRSRAQTVGDRGGDTVVEPRGDDRHRHAGGEVVSRGADQIAPGHPQLRTTGPGERARRLAGDRHRVAAPLGHVGELLQLDRGLALVVDRVPDAEQRGDRVE